MPELALGGEDGDVIGGSPKAAAQRSCFRYVTQTCAGGVGLDGAEVAGFHSGPPEGILDREAGLGSLGLRRHDVMAVTAAAAGQLPAQGSTVWGVLITHHGHHSGSLRQHKSIPVFAVGAGGLFRGIVAG